MLGHKIKKNDKTTTVSHKQSIEIISKDNDAISRFLKIEDNSIILASSIIAIDQVKEIKHIHGSKVHIKARSGLVCGGITAGFFGVLSIRQGFELDFFEIYIIIVAVPSASVAGGAINAIRHYVKAEPSYSRNWDSCGVNSP